MDGAITEWNSFNGRGKVSGSDGTHMVSAGDCSSRLLAVLENKIIPPDDPADVTYDVAGTGEAINVDLAHPIALAASAEPMAVRSLVAKKAAKKPSPKKKVAKAPRKAATKKSGGKKVAARKSRKQPRKSTRKKRRP